MSQSFANPLPFKTRQSLDGVLPRPPKTTDEYIPNFIKAAPILRPSDFAPKKVPTTKEPATKAPIKRFSSPPRPIALTPQPVQVDVFSPKPTIEPAPELSEAETLNQLVEDVPKQPLQPIDFSPPNSKQSFISFNLQSLSVVLACAILGISALNLALGQVAVGIYALACIVFKLKSETSFTIAIMALSCIPVFLFLQNNALASSFAIYAFLLLALGLFSALQEQKNTRQSAN